MSSNLTTGVIFRPTRIWFLANLYTLSPFDPNWGAALRLALCEPTLPLDETAWSLGGAPNPRLDSLTPELRRGVTVYACELATGIQAIPSDLTSYRGAALFVLWEEFAARIQGLIDNNEVAVPFYDAFVERHRYLFGHLDLTLPEPAHLLALFYQARRAWYFPATKILGKSPSAAAARLAIWRANLGGDICTYADSLYRCMDEVPVLITGETGTGKELAARCIAWSRYIPFDAGARRFARKYDDDFHTRSIREVPEALLASTLFGYKRGSFTGATADTPGFFALGKQHGTLFLDEAGEIPENVQATLLRPFQNREYIPVGETRPRQLLGRLIFATNRDLEAMCQEGTFRPDLFERMNGVHVHMPSLRQMIAESPDEMRGYVRAFVAERIHDPALIETWTERILGFIAATKQGYPWSRNLRELWNYTRRCILGFVPKRSWPAPPPAKEVPPPVKEAPPPVKEAPPPEEPESYAADGPPSTCLPSSGILGPTAKDGNVTIEQLDRSLVKRMNVITGGNIAEIARRLGLDRRTVIKLLKDPQ